MVCRVAVLLARTGCVSSQKAFSCERSAAGSVAIQRINKAFVIASAARQSSRSKRHIAKGGLNEGIWFATSLRSSQGRRGGGLPRRCAPRKDGGSGGLPRRCAPRKDGLGVVAKSLELRAERGRKRGDPADQ